VSVDTAELRELILALDQAAEQAPAEVRKVVQRGALNIKNDWRRRWSGHPHYPALPYAISYDTMASAGGVEAEIGPDKARPQGALGNLIEFGSRNNAPLPGGLPALQAEEPRAQAALAALAERLLAEGGRG
jgi:hypothetical protein